MFRSFLNCVRVQVKITPVTMTHKMSGKIFSKHIFRYDLDTADLEWPINV